MSYELILEGCRAEPLAGYLKALGVLRLVAAQVDPDARGAWSDDGFALRSKLDRADLRAFFLDLYVPTPILAPWNGRGGFLKDDGVVAAIEKSKTDRLASYRDAIRTVRVVFKTLKIKAKAEGDDKRRLIESLRAAYPPPALEWLDAVVCLGESGPRYPPLLGTGGNDGSMDFTSNQLQRLAELLVECVPSSGALLDAALFGLAVPGLSRDVAVGQFNPAAVGGDNAGPGFDRDSLTNPWDYVLTLEGAVMMGAAASRRYEDEPDAMAFPFMVRSVASGYASAAAKDEADSRNELWLPTWRRPASAAEVAHLLSEGRVSVNGRPARSALDFGRAVGALGVDRGIEEFVRFAFHMRNGKNYLALPLERRRVERSLHVGLLDSPGLDEWLRRARAAATHDRAPAALTRAGRRLDDAVLDLTRPGSGGTEAEAVLVALGAFEQALSRDAEPVVGPVPALDHRWVEAIDDGSVEMRLALSLAAAGLRESLVRVRWSRPWQWLEHDDKRTVWTDADLIRNLVAVLRRREVDEATGWTRAFAPRATADLDDVAAFIEDNVDDRRVEVLTRGLSLVDWPSARLRPTEDRSPERQCMAPCALYQLLKLAHERDLPGGTRLPRTPGMLARAASGDAMAAASLAARRLRAAGLRPRAHRLDEPPSTTRRVAAALAFPIRVRDLERLIDHAMNPRKEEV